MDSVERAWLRTEPRWTLEKEPEKETDAIQEGQHCAGHPDPGEEGTFHRSLCYRDTKGKVPKKTGLDLEGGDLWESLERVISVVGTVSQIAPPWGHLVQSVNAGVQRNIRLLSYQRTLKGYCSSWAPQGIS